MRPGTRFDAGAVRPAGHIFIIPAAERLTDDAKSRPHFLANRCDPQSDPNGLATLAHMSTKNTECVQYGCSCHEIIDHASLKRADQDGNFVVAARLMWLRKQIEVLDETVDAATLAAIEARIGERLRL